MNDEEWLKACGITDAENRLQSIKRMHDEEQEFIKAGIQLSECNCIDELGEICDECIKAVLIVRKHER